MKRRTLIFKAWVANISEWVWYTNWEQERKLREASKRWGLEMIGTKVRRWVQHKDEEQLLAPFKVFFKSRADTSIEQILSYSNAYLPARKSLGEMTLNAGNTIHFYHAGCDGVVDLSPFTCMNAIVTEAIYPMISHDLKDFPIRIFYFDGIPIDLDKDLEIFMELVKSYRRRRLNRI